MRLNHAGGRARLISRNGHPFVSFANLATDIGNSLPNAMLTVLDGEICSLDRRGKPQFRNLLFRRGHPPCFFVFDVLICDGNDCRTERLSDRKQELRRLLARVSADSVKYTEYVDGSGTALFERVCKMDLEGIVAKHKFGPYVTEREQSTWLKIRNANYSQWAGREKLFERERNREPVAGWHSCVIASAELEPALRKTGSLR